MLWGWREDPQKSPMTLLWPFTTLLSDRSYANNGMWLAALFALNKETKEGSVRRDFWRSAWLSSVFLYKHKYCFLRETRGRQLVGKCSSTISAQLQLLAMLGRVIKVIETLQPSSYNIKSISDSTVEALGRICCLIWFQEKYRRIQNGDSANQDVLFKFNLKK